MDSKTAMDGLGFCLARGYVGSYVELIGGGDLGITMPLESGWAQIDSLGLGIYPEDWSGEDVPMYYFESTLTAEDFTKSLDWLDNEIAEREDIALLRK